MPNGEIWSTGFWVHGGVPTDSAGAYALAQLAAFEFNANDDSGAMRLSFYNLGNAQQIWDTVTAYCYPTGGPTATAIGQYVMPTPVAGSNSAHNPNQVALVLTLRTALAGRAHRGRMYLPAVGVPLGTDGQVAQSVLDVLTAAWALAFGDWNAASTPKIVIVSQSRKGDATYPGGFTPVTTVSMDSRCDIQRSRANKETILRDSTHALAS
jgi:hypothetical protein